MRVRMRVRMASCDCSDQVRRQGRKKRGWRCRRLLLLLMLMSLLLMKDRAWVIRAKSQFGRQRLHHARGGAVDPRIVSLSLG